MVMEASPSPQSVGREFVRQYYTLLNKAPAHLHRFYNNYSSFVHGGLDAPNRETLPVVGQKQIHNRIQQLNFRDCHAKISQVDAQATLGNGVVVQVTGELSNGGAPMRRFTQTFVLAAQSPKKYYVHNDIFRYQDIVFSDEEGEGSGRSEGEEEEAGGAGYFPPPPPPSAFPPATFPAPPAPPHAPLVSPAAPAPPAAAPAPAAPHLNGHPPPHDESARHIVSALQASPLSGGVNEREPEPEPEALPVSAPEPAPEPEPEREPTPPPQPAVPPAAPEPKTYANLLKSGSGAGPQRGSPPAPAPAPTRARAPRALTMTRRSGATRSRSSCSWATCRTAPRRRRCARCSRASGPWPSCACTASRARRTPTTGSSRTRRRRPRSSACTPRRSTSPPTAPTPSSSTWRRRRRAAASRRAAARCPATAPPTRRAPPTAARRPPHPHSPPPPLDSLPVHFYSVPHTALLASSSPFYSKKIFQARYSWRYFFSVKVLLNPMSMGCTRISGGFTARRTGRPDGASNSRPRAHRVQDARTSSTSNTTSFGESIMRCRLVLLALLVAAICAVDAEGPRERHRRRHRRLRTTTTTESPGGAPVASDDADSDHELSMAERLDEKKFQDSERARVLELINEISRHGVPDHEIYLDDPCLKVHCSAGRVCEIDEHGEAVCNCIKECPYETESRRKVCTNYNETWTSDCEVYRQRCLCLDGSELCRGAQYHHVQIEYYGTCREMPECSESEMSDFPRRMRDWLFNIMRDMAERSELTPHYLQMEREAESNLTRRWTNAAIWKWCDLDAHDNDRYVSRHELFPIRAPLMALEHCIAPFLERCDEDDDHRITLAEWGKCLELDESELEDRCDEFIDDSNA